MMSAERNAEASSEVEQFFHSITRRDPSKRQIKPVTSAQFTLFDELDSDSDSEFVCDEKDDEGDSEIEESDENAPSDSESEKTDSSSDNSKSTSGDTPRPSALANEETFENTEESAIQQENSDIAEVAQSEDLLKERRLEVDLNLSCKMKGKAGVTNKSDFLVCMVCLGDSDDPNDELIECDGCGVVVHEDCYKVVDSIFMSSGASSSSTDAWFCEACLAGVCNPCCELCPNTNGAFKRTDNNRWVHLICALYTPGVAFNDPENLMDVTLTELPPKTWSAHECSLCEERFFAWTGVCIACDAGLCRTFFHVTCAQKHGLLSEPTVEENTVDPFFAQCRQHTDKTVARHRRRNYLTAMSHLRKRNQAKLEHTGLSVLGSPVPNTCESKNFNLLEPRIQRKLENFRNLYEELLRIRDKPYVPSSKVPLFLENSPVAMRLFVSKAKALQLPLELTGQSATNDSLKATPSGYPVFSPDFVSYFFEREKRIAEVSKRISALQNTQRELQIADASASHSYNSVAAQLDEITARRTVVHENARRMLNSLQCLVPELKASAALEPLLEEPNRLAATKAETDIESDQPTNAARISRFARQKRSNALSSAARISLHRAAQRKLSGPNLHPAARWSPKPKVDKERVNPSVGQSADEADTVILECVVCHGLQDQHLITKCDTCAKAFHLACLDPPLLRMPKRSKLYGWQCSHCTKAVASNTEVVLVDINAPRQLRRSVGRSSDADTVKTISQTPKSSTDSAIVSKVEQVQPKPEPVAPLVSSPSCGTGPGRSRPIFTTARTGLSTTAIGNRIMTSARGRRKQSITFRRSTVTAAKRTRTEQSCAQEPQTGAPVSLPTQPTIVVSQMDASAGTKVTENRIPEPKKLDAYDYDMEPNSDEEIAKLRSSKVIKFVQIRDHSANDDSETVEQIAPLHMRYMICPENTGMQRRSSAGRFRMKLKKL